MSFCPAADNIVTELALDCLGLFERSCGDNVPVPVPQLIDQRGRFRIWLSDLGVFNHGNKSLEYRLIWDVGTRQGVAILLQNLRDDLRELQTIESQIRADDRPSVEVTTNTVILEQKSVYESQTNFMTILKAVEKDVDVLRSLANSIRKADGDLNKNIDDNKRIGNELETNDEIWLASMNRELRLMFPMADPFVLNRLKDTMFLRRKWFRHRKHHRRGRGIRLSGAVQSLSKTTVSSQASSDLDENMVLGQSPTHIASATAGTSPGQSHFNMPPLPKVYANVEFICPYCMIILPVPQADAARTWTEHLQEDLDPYVCLIDNCSRPTVLYSTQDEWSRHIKQEHMKRWVCRVRSHKVTIFDSELEYVDHMNQYHARTFHSAQLELLKTKSTCYTGQIFKSCPICGQSKFRDSAEAEGHVAAHLVALASECFPIDEEDNIVLQSMASSYIKLVDVFLPKSVETAFRSAQAENIKLQDFNKDENHPEVEASLDFGMLDRPDCVLRVVQPLNTPTGRDEILAPYNEDQSLLVGFKRLYPADESIFEDLVLRSTQNLDRAALQVTPAQDGSVFQDELILYLCILRDGITLEGKSDYLKDPLTSAYQSLAAVCALNRTLRVEILSEKSARPLGPWEIQAKLFFFKILKELLLKASGRLQEALSPTRDRIGDHSPAAIKRKSDKRHRESISGARMPDQSVKKENSTGQTSRSRVYVASQANYTSPNALKSGGSAPPLRLVASDTRSPKPASVEDVDDVTGEVIGNTRISTKSESNSSYQSLGREQAASSYTSFHTEPKLVEPLHRADDMTTKRRSTLTERERPEEGNIREHRYRSPERPTRRTESKVRRPESSQYTGQYLPCTDPACNDPECTIASRKHGSRPSPYVYASSPPQYLHPPLFRSHPPVSYQPFTTSDRQPIGIQPPEMPTASRPVTFAQESFDAFVAAYGRPPMNRYPYMNPSDVPPRPKAPVAVPDRSADTSYVQTSSMSQAKHVPLSHSPESYARRASAAVPRWEHTHEKVYSMDDGNKSYSLADIYINPSRPTRRDSAERHVPRMRASSRNPAVRRESSEMTTDDGYDYSARLPVHTSPHTIPQSCEWMPPFTMLLLLASTLEECQHLILKTAARNPYVQADQIDTLQELVDIEHQFSLLTDRFHQRFASEKQHGFNFAACCTGASEIEAAFLDNIDELANESQYFLRSRVAFDASPPEKIAYRSRLIARFLLSFLHSKHEDEALVAGLRESEDNREEQRVQKGLILGYSTATRFDQVPTPPDSEYKPYGWHRQSSLSRLPNLAPLPTRVFGPLPSIVEAPRPLPTREDSRNHSTATSQRQTSTWQRDHDSMYRLADFDDELLLEPPPTNTMQYSRSHFARDERLTGTWVRDYVSAYKLGNWLVVKRYLQELFPKNQHPHFPKNGWDELDFDIEYCKVELWAIRVPRRLTVKEKEGLYSRRLY